VPARDRVLLSARGQLLVSATEPARWLVARQRPSPSVRVRRTGHRQTQQLRGDALCGNRAPFRRGRRSAQYNGMAQVACATAVEAVIRPLGLWRTMTAARCTLRPPRRRRQRLREHERREDRRPERLDRRDDRGAHGANRERPSRNAMESERRRESASAPIATTLWARGRASTARPSPAPISAIMPRRRVRRCRRRGHPAAEMIDKGACRSRRGPRREGERHSGRVKRRGEWRDGP